MINVTITDILIAINVFFIIVVIININILIILIIISNIITVAQITALL